jgi:hypothetical protein
MTLPARVEFNGIHYEINLLEQAQNSAILHALLSLFELSYFWGG